MLVKEVITKELYYCHEDDDIKQVTDMMCQKQVHRLAVYDKKINFQVSYQLAILPGNVKTLPCMEG